MFKFEIEKKSTETKARTGKITTSHGDIKTPVFMPVGTLGSVKSLTRDDLIACGAQIILGNTYHLYLRPGCDVISKFNGLHNFINWKRPILTDSGGFQVFSLAKLLKLTDEGANFQSHIDGSSHFLTPEKSIEIQLILGSDIIMCLDECVKYPEEKDKVEKSLILTTNWAKRCKTFWEQAPKNTSNLFGIVQGGMFKDLRKKSLNELIDIDFCGYAVGGLSVGEPKDLMMEMADFTIPKLPENKPRYVMGVGMPEDLVELVSMGADMFDCVLPTRNARNGQLFTNEGKLNIANSKFKFDEKPIEEKCKCYTCQNHSRAYLRHLYLSKELLSYSLNSIHNVYYFISLMNDIRNAIENNNFNLFKKEFYQQQKNNDYA